MCLHQNEFIRDNYAYTPKRIYLWQLYLRLDNDVTRESRSRDYLSRGANFLGDNNTLRAVTGSERPISIFILRTHTLRVGAALI